jgi:hypothetical protein
MTTIDHTLQYVYYSEGNSLVSDRYADEWDIENGKNYAIPYVEYWSDMRDHAEKMSEVMEELEVRTVCLNCGKHKSCNKKFCSILCSIEWVSYPLYNYKSW